MNLSLKSLQAEARWRALRNPTAADGDRAPAAVLADRAGAHVRWVSTVFALAAAALILWIFYGVVRGSILQGETRRATVVQHELAVWRCARQGGRAARDACMAQIDPVPLKQFASPR
jgi:hypothetical protein